LVIVQVAFAMGAVEGKLTMAPAAEGGGAVSPWALAMARMAGAAIFFQSLRALRRERASLSWGDHGRVAGLSILGIVLNQALYLYGLRITAAFSAALLGAAIPVFTAAIAIALRQERASAWTGIGVLVASADVVWLTGVHDIDSGVVFVTLNGISYSFYVVLARRVIARIGALTVITWLFTWGAIIFAPIGARDLVVGAASWSSRGWMLVAIVIAMPTIVAYLGNAWALGRSTATLVTVYIYMQPLLTALLGWFQIGQGLSSRMIVSAALIFAGVTIVSIRRSRP
jgi:drug/metabolite transporter (DMT)-like permease